MTFRISTAIADAIRAEAAACPDAEICGLLLGTGHRVTAHRAARNVAADPATRFEIDPGTLFAALRDARGGGAQVIGYYHSHPGGDPAPSATDAAMAAADGRLWLIVGRGAMLGWRAVAGGARHGRFDPVALDFG